MPIILITNIYNHDKLFKIVFLIKIIITRKQEMKMN